MDADCSASDFKALNTREQDNDFVSGQSRHSMVSFRVVQAISESTAADRTNIFALTPSSCFNQSLSSPKRLHVEAAVLQVARG